MRWTRATDEAWDREEIKAIIINHIFRLRVREDALARTTTGRARPEEECHMHMVAERGLADVMAVVEKGLPALAVAVEEGTLRLMN